MITLLIAFQLYGTNITNFNNDAARAGVNCNCQQPNPSPGPTPKTSVDSTFVGGDTGTTYRSKNDASHN